MFKKIKGVKGLNKLMVNVGKGYKEGQQEE